MKIIILINSIMLLLISCSTIPTADQNTIDEAFNEPNHNIDTTLDPLLPEDVSNALIPDLNASLYPAATPKDHSHFNISVNDADARDFFMGLVIDSHVNMLVHPEVSGTISLELKNVTIDQVLEATQKIYGYDYKKNDIGYMIFPASMQTKVFKLNRLDLIRRGLSSTQVSSGQLSSGSDEGGDSGGSSDSDEGSDDSNGTTSGSWIQTQTLSDAWAELELAIRSIISIDPSATVVINRQSGAIVVRAKPMQLREVEEFIQLTQQQISRQVILEAKIIEIILDDSHQAGVNWQSIVRDGINSTPLLTGVGALTAIESFREVFTIGGSWGDFRAYVELLETQGKTNILSSPRVSTLNNQKAIIKVGRDEFFITEVSSNNQAGANGLQNQTQEITFTQFFSGISLDVTPQINDNDEVTLHIHPSITRVQDQTKTFTINGRDGSLPVALNTVRESDSIIKAKNGQIVVIGGLMQETKKENKKGVAGLSQIPFLGNLFRVNNGETQKSELVILLKPTIINGDSDWVPSMDASNQQLKQLHNHQLWQ